MQLLKSGLQLRRSNLHFEVITVASTDGEICCDMGKNTGNVTWGELFVDNTKGLSTAQNDTKGT